MYGTCEIVENFWYSASKSTKCKTVSEQKNFLTSWPKMLNRIPKDKMLLAQKVLFFHFFH